MRVSAWQPRQLVERRVNRCFANSCQGTDDEDRGGFAKCLLIAPRDTAASPKIVLLNSVTMMAAYYINLYRLLKRFFLIFN